MANVTAPLSAAFRDQYSLGAATKITAEVVELLNESLPQGSVQAMTDPLRAAVQKAISDGWDAGYALKALETTYESNVGQTKGAMTFDDFDKYATFAMKVIVMMSGAGIAYISYRHVFKVARGVVTPESDPRAFDAAATELTRASTTVREVMKTTMEHMKWTHAEWCQNVLKLLERADEKKKADSKQ